MTTVVGHRGARGIRPENTLAAFDYAVEVGADMVEFDVRETADGHLVLMHDASVDRTTDGTGDVSELRLAEIRELDAGDGERVPTLAEVLEAVAERGVGAYIEIKEPGTARRVVAAARDHGVASSSEFIGGDMDVLATVAEMGAPVGGNVPDFTDETLERAAELDYQHVGVRHENVTEELVERVHSYGIAVTAWPVSDPAVARRMAALGVDVINSDRPGVVLDALDE